MMIKGYDFEAAVMKPAPVAVKVQYGYDRTLRLWSAWKLDAEDNQMGECGYGGTAARALADLDAAPELKTSATKIKAF